MSPHDRVIGGPAPRGRARRVLAALGALLVLGAAVGGVPVALLRFGTWPIRGVPTGDQLRDIPSAVVSDGALVGIVTVLLWVAWGLFVASVAVELVVQVRARLRGEDRAARSIGGPIQAAARYLVGSLLVSAGPLAGVGTALPAGALSPAPASVEHAGSWSPDASGTGLGPVLDLEEASWEAPPASMTLTASATTVTVGRGDTAWSLATEHLGDGARWREIWEANREQLQPDGSRWDDADQPVQAGWVLTIVGGSPTTATTPPGATPTEGPAQSPPAQLLLAAPAAPTEVTVESGDNLWDLAEGQLTSEWGRAPTDAEVVPHWQALVETNRQALVPPHDPDLIFPGQVFSVPTPPPAPEGLQRLVPEVVPDEPAPAGAAEAPVCAPEEAPAEEAPTEMAPAEEAASEGGAPTTPGPPDTGSGPDSGADTGTGSDDSAAVPPAPDERPEASAPTPPPEPGDGVDPVETGAGDEGEGDSGSLAPIGLAGAGVATAGALVLLERRRRAQQRHRRPGRMVPTPPAPLRVDERELRWGADVDGARLLDVAVRAAAAGAGATGLPPLRWVESGPDVVVLVLAGPSPAPPGFVARASDRWVTAAGLDELAALASHAAPPAPTLVPVGTSDSGTEVLVDLETAGAMTVHARPDVAEGFLRALVVATATSVWSEQVRVLTVGLDPLLAELPGVTVVPNLRDALALAEDHADRIAAALRSVRCPTLAQARAVGAMPEQWDPLVVVADVAPRDRDERRRLAALAARPDSGVGLVVRPGVEHLAAGRAVSIGDHGWLSIDGVDEPVLPRLLGAEEVVAIAGLLDHAAQRVDVPPGEMAAVLTPRRPPPPPPPGPPPSPVPQARPASAGPLPLDDPPASADAAVWETDAVAADHADAVAADHADAADLAEDEADDRAADPAPVGLTSAARPPATPGPPPRLASVLADVAVLVRVLGEVEAVRLDGSGAEERLVPTRQRALEAIAYLALRESAVDREDLEISLFPNGANAAKTIYNSVSAARALVGEDLFPAPGSGRYELSPAVVTDYGVFCELVATAEEIEDAAVAADVLTDALGLVRGEPFTGVGRGYAWVGPHRGMIVAQAVDAAEELAEVRLAMGDWRSAEWAARQGLRAFPSDERMYRLLMRTARAAGNIPGVQRVFRELCDVLADPDIGVEPEDTVHPETVELLEELTGAPLRQARLGA